MSLRRLKTFIAVAQCGSLSAAADALFLTIPAVSQQLRSLEQELKTPLFDRATRPARLNSAGEALLVRAREIVALYERLPEAVSEVNDLAGAIVVGAIPTALSGVVPRAIKAMYSVHKRLEIRLIHGLSPSLAEQLHRGEINAAIISEPPELPETLQWRPVTDEPIMIIAPPDVEPVHGHRLLHELPYIRFNRRFWVSRIIENYLRVEGITLREVMELDSLEAIALMVHHGLGMSIVPLCSDTPWLQLVTQIPLGTPPLTRTLGFAERVDNPRRAITAALYTELKVAAGLMPVEMAS